MFVELAALRNEVRTKSRLVKEALDQFRGVFGTLQSSHATLEQELKRAQADTQERGRALLRPLLLELLDLRDRLAAGLQQPTVPPRALVRLAGAARRHADAEGWREGLGITLRRLDRILAERRVVRIEMTGRRFDPRMGRVVGTTRGRERRQSGIVVDEVSAGFLWDDELLRAAEVIVNKIRTPKQGRLHDDGRNRRHRPGNDQFRDRGVPGRPPGNPGRRAGPQDPALGGGRHRGRGASGRRGGAQPMAAVSRSHGPIDQAADGAGRDGADGRATTTRRRRSRRSSSGG